MKVDCIIVGLFEVNAYVLSVPPVPDALVIDPGADADKLLQYLNTHKLKPMAYLLTHGHADHVSALAELCREFPAPVALSAADAAWAFTKQNMIPGFYDTPEAPPSVDRILADGQRWNDGPFSYEVIETPGHTPGGICLYFPAEGVLFSGDTLFQDSVGRTDLRGGDPRALARSLKRLKALPDHTRVFAGHGSVTTIAEEKASNFFFRSPAG